MFESPIRWIICCAFFSAPAPIESIAMTAPTPKIIPSMVSADRSLWTARLRSARMNASPGFKDRFRVRRLSRRRRGRGGFLGCGHGDGVAVGEAGRHDDAPDRGRAERHGNGREAAAIAPEDDLL